MCGCASLGERLYSNDPARRTAALKEFQKAGNQEQAKAVWLNISALKSHAPKTRRAAALSLAGMGRPAVPALFEVLKGTDTVFIKLEILAIIGDMGEAAAEAVPELIRLINGPDWNLRKMAQKALIKIGAPAVPMLIAQRSNINWSEDGNARDALKQIGTPAAKAIGEATLTADKGLKEDLYLLLVEIGRKGSIDDVLPLVLSAFSDPAQDQRFIPALLFAIGPPATPGLIANLKNSDAGIRRRSVEILSHICYQTKCGLEKFVPELIEALKDENIRKDTEFLLNTDPVARQRYADIMEHERNAARKAPCLPAIPERETDKIPGRPEYDKDKIYALLSRGFVLDNKAQVKISFKVPECGFSPAELEKMAIVRFSSNTKADFLPVTIKDGFVSATSTHGGSFFLQIPLRIIDTAGPVLKLKYTGGALTGAVPHINSMEPVAVEAVDRSSYSFAVAGIGGVYVLFNKKPGPKCYASRQKPDAPFGSYKNCVYQKPFLVPEGLQHITVSSFDKLENAGETLNLTVYSDATPPKGVFGINGRPVSPGTTVYAEETDTFTITATDPVPKPVEPGEVKIHILANISKEECDYAEGIGGIDGMGSCENPVYQGPFTIPPGEHVIYYSSEDAVGNRSVENQVNIIVKRRNP